MTKTNTFRNVNRVTEEYDGSWMGAGWYAYEYAEHVRIEYLECPDEMTEEYVDFVGDHASAIAETIGGVVCYVHFGEYADIEESYVNEVMENSAMPPEDNTEEAALDFFKLYCTDMDKRGCVHDEIVLTDGIEVTFGKWSPED